MFIEVMNSKIHRAKVTDANLNYIGSVTIDEDLSGWMRWAFLPTNKFISLMLQTANGL